MRWSTKWRRNVKAEQSQYQRYTSERSLRCTVYEPSYLKKVIYPSLQTWVLWINQSILTQHRLYGFRLCSLANVFCHRWRSSPVTGLMAACWRCRLGLGWGRVVNEQTEHCTLRNTLALRLLYIIVIGLTNAHRICVQALQLQHIIVICLTTANRICV